MQYGAVNRNKPGNDVSGDTFLFHQNPESTLVALIDGLGSGLAAHEAAQGARQCVDRHAALPLTEILKLCHRALRGTRGVVMMLMRVDHQPAQVSFAGVGNIGVRVFSDPPIRPLSRNGIVGYRMNNVREFTYPYTKGDTFILYSDGVSTSFTVDESLVRGLPADLQQAAEEIADNFGKDDDIAVVIVR